MEGVGSNEDGKETPEMVYAGGVMKNIEELRQLVRARGTHSDGLGFGEDVTELKDKMRTELETLLASIAPGEGSENEAQSRLH